MEQHLEENENPDTIKVIGLVEDFFAKKGIAIDKEVVYGGLAWKARGEDYCRNSVAVFIHDGGILAHYFSFDEMDYDSIEEMRVYLAEHGFYSEQGTNWYSGIYRC